MAAREGLITELLETIGDYRKGKIKPIDYAHVEKWINQFEPEKQLPLLSEIVHILKKTYFSKKRIEDIFLQLINHSKFAGPDPAKYWSTVSLLDIQEGGNSQHEFVGILSNLITSKLGGTPLINSNTASVYWYIDDGLFSGSRVTNDVSKWIKNNAPSRATLFMTIISLHKYGEYNTNKKLNEVIKESGKNITINWLQHIYPEDRKRYMYSSDVLRPTCAPQDESVTNYIQGMKYQPVYRQPGSIGSLQFFTSESGRHLLEQEFLIKGMHIRTICPNLKIPHRPLGFSILETLGFGSMFVTYRNCPNNAPLALWAGDPWYPLFPRSTNADAAVERAFEAL